MRAGYNGDIVYVIFLRSSYSRRCYVKDITIYAHKTALWIPSRKRNIKIYVRCWSPFHDD